MFCYYISKYNIVKQYRFLKAQRMMRVVPIIIVILQYVQWQQHSFWSMASSFGILDDVISASFGHRLERACKDDRQP